jgi:hypothetical protein
MTSPVGAAPLDLAVSLYQQGRVVDATLQASRRLCLAPDDGYGWLLLGNFSYAQRDLSLSRVAFEHAIQVTPSAPEAVFNLGNLYFRSGNYGAALGPLRRALSLSPARSDAWVLLSTAQRLSGYLPGAERSGWHAIALSPEQDGPAVLVSQLLLMRSEFRQGWSLYERRLVRQVSSIQTPHPPLDSIDRARGSVLLWGEQGIGDEIMFASLLSEAIASFSAVVLQSDARLKGFFRRSFPDLRVFDYSEIPPVDSYTAHLPLGSLGLHFRSHETDFSRQPAGYFQADPERVRAVRSQLARKAGEIIVGVSWSSSSPEHGEMRSLDLQALCSALNFPMVRFVNLQYGDVSRDLAALDASVRGRIFVCPEIDNLRDLDGLAALMCNCDLIVTVGNTTAHLAGALGLKAWVLLPFSPSWRWMNSGSQTPWYPALRLYRQAATKDWQSVLDQVRREFTHHFSPNTLGVSQ